MSELVEKRGWTEQEAKDYIIEVERLKELWYSEVINIPVVSITKALTHLREAYKSTNRFDALEKENEQRRIHNEQIRKEMLRMLELENKNLEWPKPDRPLKARKPSDYWRYGCLYCSYYKPRTTHVRSI